MRPNLVLLLLSTLPLLPAQAAQPASATPVAQPGAEDAALLAFLDRAFDEAVALSPETQTRLGFKTS